MMKRSTKKKRLGKSVAKTARQFLLVHNQIYYVQSQTDREKLRQFESSSYSRLPRKQPPSNRHYQSPNPLTSSTAHLQPPKPQPRRHHRHHQRPNPPTLTHQISLLSLTQKQTLLRQIQKDVESTRAGSLMDVLEQQLQDVYMNIHEKHNKCMSLLEEARERISRTEFGDKEDIIRRIKDRKIRLLNNVREVFKEVVLKEQQVNEGSLSLSQIMYSAEICPSSSERLADQEELKQDKIKLIKHLQNKLQLKLEKEDSSPPKVDPPKNQPEIDLQCEEKRPKNIIIPAIMTKDKRQQIEKEKNLHQQRWAESQIQKRIGLQLGYIEHESTVGIATSLTAMNRYLQALIDYITKNYLNDVLELINMPFGKSVQERLVELHGRSVTSQDDLPFILSDRLFIEVQKRLIKPVKQSDPLYQTKQCQHIHNRAMFDCLNHSLNIYRPYYSFGGQVFPWLVTEKGMTFYSINEDNIGEVFDKCKMKILETAASLCGVLTSEEMDGLTKGVYERKREEFLRRAIVGEFQEEGEKWTALEVAEARLRMGVSEHVWQRLLQEFVDQW